MNCELIRHCLNAAASDLAHAADVDEATRNVQGSPAIFETILEKIKRCAVFVCDLTLLQLVGDSGRYSCNPNVLIEYGYALANLADKKIISVVNTHFGPLEKLPFDLRHKAVKCTYELGPTATDDDLARAKTELTLCLLHELRLVLEDPSAELNLGDAAVRIAQFFVERSGDRADHQHVGQEVLAAALELEEKAVHGAVAELIGRRYLDRLGIVGTTTPPVRPNPRLFWDFDRFFKGWDPKKDALRIASAVVGSSQTGHGRLNTRDFATEQGWPLRRLNAALRYLVEANVVDSSQGRISDLVTGYIRENELTREYVEGRFDLEARRRS